MLRFATPQHHDVDLGREGTPSIVPVHPLAPLVAFLRLDRQRGDWTGVKPPEADRFACLLAIAVGAVVDPLQRRVDLRDQLALPVARPEFERPVRLGRGAVGEIRQNVILVLQMRDGFLAFPGECRPSRRAALYESIPFAVRS